MKTIDAQWQASIGKLSDGTWGVQFVVTGFSSEEEACAARKEIQNMMEEAFDLDAKIIKSQ